MNGLIIARWLVNLNVKRMGWEEHPDEWTISLASVT